MFSSSRVGNYRKVIELPAAGRFPNPLKLLSRMGRLEETRPKGEKVDGGGELLQPSKGHLSAQDRHTLHFNFRFIKLEIKTLAGCQRDRARVPRRIFAQRERH